MISYVVDQALLTIPKAYNYIVTNKMDKFLNLEVID